MPNKLKTKKRTNKRKSPTNPASQFHVGYFTRANDGRFWKVIKSGKTKRWSLVSNNLYPLTNNPRKPRKITKRKPHKKTIRMHKPKLKSRARRVYSTKGGKIRMVPKGRKGPSASATDYSVGTVRKGLDGNMWQVVYAGSSRRWKRL